MKNHAAQESGTALIVAMLLMLVLTIMLIGFYFVTSGEQKVAASNRDNEVTYYWAVAGLEQMSSLMADYFSHTASPTPAQLTSWLTNPSQYQSYPLPIPTSGLPLVTCTYNLYCSAPCSPAPCTPVMVPCANVAGGVLGSSSGAIGGNGPLAGLEGVITPFMLQVVADGPNNTEVKLSRTVQEVAVPIFEFGIFSDSDLSFFAGPNFAFGGRTHTNGNLFLAEDGGDTLSLNDHVTAAKGIIRDELSNGYTMATYPSTSGQYSGAYCAYVNVLTTAGGCPATKTGPQTGNCLTLQLNQGSVENGPGSTENPNWKSLSTNTYNGFIQDGTTGAKVLNLAIALPGIQSQPIAMLQRPPAGESPTNPLGLARFYNQASLRILLSDTQSDIMNLPGIDTTEDPYPLAEYGSVALANMPYTIQRSATIPSTYCPPSSNCSLPSLGPLQPPLAESVGSSTDSDYMTAAGTTLLGGYIKIEMQCTPTAGCTGTWKDVTEEILAQGISRDLLTITAEPDLNSGGSLSSGKTYYYVVTALGPWGPGGSTVETLGKEYGPYTTTSTYKTVTINWNPITAYGSTAAATGYKVYRGSSAGGETGYIQYASTVSSYNETNATLTAGSVPKSQSIVHLEEVRPWGMAAPTFNVSNTSGSLPASTTYYYEVTALGAWGESSGTQASATTGSSGSKHQVTVNWSAVPGATGYNVYRTTNTDGRSPSSGVFTGTGNGYFSVTGGTTTSYTDNGGTTPTLTTPPQLPPDSTLNSLQAVEYPQNYYPINMYDAREGEVRDNSGPTTSSLNGIMNLVEVDVGNLQQWFAGNIATSGVYAFNGPDSLNNGGYILYTSDRRMNCMDGNYDLEGACASNAVGTNGVPSAGESGEFGNEDIINPSVTSGAPNGQLDTCTTGVTACPPEDLDGDGVFRTYGAYAHPIATPTSTNPGGTSPSGTWATIASSLANSATWNPAMVRITGAQAQKNSVIIFRRALRLVNGTLGNLPPLAAARANPCSGGTGGGFSVASENPIYVQGDYNASVANGFNDAAPLCHVPSSVMGDAVTLLSNNWTPGAQLGSNTSGDANSFAYPTSPNCNNQRCATTTYFRMAVMGGKTISFPQPTWGASDSGTDGGAHNFLRYNEDWGNATLNYLGSMASFYIGRQGTGIYKCCNTVYSPPTRNYTFDTDFQNINKLPPGVPRFTDVNALSYYQSVLPSQ